MSIRQEKVNNQIKEVVAKFLESESNNLSLITVMSVDVSPDLKNAKILISVLPESREKAALDFCKRKRSEIKHEIKKKMITQEWLFFLPSKNQSYNKTGCEDYN